MQEPEPFEPFLTAKEFAERAHPFHRQVFATEPFDFGATMTRAYRPPEGWVFQDHALAHDGENWHLFYITGRIEDAAPLINAVRARDWEAARRHPYVIGEGHAVGKTLFDLNFHSRFLTEPQGEFAILCQGTSSVCRVKDHWVNVYTASGPNGQGLCLARSRDLTEWEPDARNPFWRPPAYAAGTNVCKNAHVMPYQDRYLIFYCLNLPEGQASVSLLSTRDFETFADHGPVFKMPFQFRGTQGVESPCVVLRDGIWHLFFGSGEGWWHAIGDRPDHFMSTQGISSATVLGAYCMGPFHACEIVEHAGRWWITSTFKEEHRNQCRKAGKPIFRGAPEDEASLLEGMFVGEIRWQGDQPVLVPRAEEDQQ